MDASYTVINLINVATYGAIQLCDFNSSIIIYRGIELFSNFNIMSGLAAQVVVGFLVLFTVKATKLCDHGVHFGA